MNAPLDFHAHLARRPLPAAMLQALRARFGERCSSAAAVCDQHGRDESPFPTTPPDAVVYCESTEDVAAVLRLADAYEVPVIPYGVGTSLEARINPYIPRTRLTEDDLRTLYRAALAVMAWATPLVAGAMVKDGVLDYEERRDFMRVHRLGGKPCPRCGTTISEITANQRITSFCRACQPQTPA